MVWICVYELPPNLEWFFLDQLTVFFCCISSHSNSSCYTLQSPLFSIFSSFSRFERISQEYLLIVSISPLPNLSTSTSFGATLVHFLVENYQLKVHKRTRTLIRSGDSFPIHSIIGFSRPDALFIRGGVIVVFVLPIKNSSVDVNSGRANWEVRGEVSNQVFERLEEVDLRRSFEEFIYILVKCTFNI